MGNNELKDVSTPAEEEADQRLLTLKQGRRGRRRAPQRGDEPKVSRRSIRKACRHWRKVRS